MHPPGRLLANDKFLLAKGVDQDRLDALTDAVKAVHRPGCTQELKAAIKSAKKEPHGNEYY